MSASAVLKLQKVGFTVDQVEALADFMDTQAASKADLLQETSTIRSELAEVEHRLETRIATVRADLEKMELRLTIKLGAMLAAGIAIVATVVKLIH
jgi:hypothetical protein